MRKVKALYFLIFFYCKYRFRMNTLVEQDILHVTAVDFSLVECIKIKRHEIEIAV